MSWPIVKLGELVQVKGGKRLPKGSEYSENRTEYPYIRVTDFKNNSVRTSNLVYIEKEIHEKIARYTISCDDVYISIAGTIGIVGVIPEQLDGANLTENAAKLIIKNPKELDKNYLVRFLSTVGQNQLHERKKVTSQPKLALFRIEEVEIPLPPLEEQKRIAAILDKADAIRRKRQQATQLADDFLRAVFLDMFGDPVINPKGWEVKPLVSLCNKITDGTHHSPPIVENGVPYITAKHLKTTGLEFHSNPWFVSKEEHQKIFSRCNPEPKDVLYIKDGATTGLAAINEYDFEFSMLSSLALLKPNYDLITSEFLCSFLNHPKTKLVLTANMAGAAITRLTLAKIKDVRVPLPSIESQMKFSEVYNSVRELVGKIKKSDNLALDEFNSLSQKAFAGEL